MSREIEIFKYVLLAICALTFVVSFFAVPQTAIQQIYFGLVQGFSAVCFCILLPKQ